MSFDVPTHHFREEDVDDARHGLPNGGPSGDRRVAMAREDAQRPDVEEAGWVGGGLLDARFRRGATRRDRHQRRDEQQRRQSLHLFLLDALQQ